MDKQEAKEWLLGLTVAVTVFLVAIGLTVIVSALILEEIFNMILVGLFIGLVGFLVLNTLKAIYVILRSD